jgi:hypothetical protein
MSRLDMLGDVQMMCEVLWNLHEVLGNAVVHGPHFHGNQ